METTYSITVDSCQISWIVMSGINKGVVKHRSECDFTLDKQLPFLSKILDKVFEDRTNVRTIRTLFWGRLLPDGGKDFVMSQRLAIAAKASPLWDAERGRPKSSEFINVFIARLANEAVIYKELNELFEKHKMKLRVSGVEKVLVANANQFPFFDELRKRGIKATEKLPYDCMTWFSVSTEGL